jgi:hypothetical protein
MGIIQYFEDIWVGSHLTDMVTGIIGAVLAFLGPAIIVTLGGQNNIFEAAAATVIASIALDGPSLGQDIASGDAVGFAAELGSIAYQAAEGILSTLSTGELIEYAITETLWSIGTVGVGDTLQLVSGTVAAAVTGGGLLAQFLYDYYDVYGG